MVYYVSDTPRDLGELLERLRKENQIRFDDIYFDFEVTVGYTLVRDTQLSRLAKEILKHKIKTVYLIVEDVNIRGVDISLLRVLCKDYNVGLKILN